MSQIVNLFQYLYKMGHSNIKMYFTVFPKGEYTDVTEVEIRAKPFQITDPLSEIIQHSKRIPYIQNIKNPTGRFTVHDLEEAIGAYLGPGIEQFVINSKSVDMDDVTDVYAELDVDLEKKKINGLLRVSYTYNHHIPTNQFHTNLGVHTKTDMTKFKAWNFPTEYVIKYSGSGDDGGIDGLEFSYDENAIKSEELENILRDASWELIPKIADFNNEGSWGEIVCTINIKDFESQGLVYLTASPQHYDNAVASINLTGDIPYEDVPIYTNIFQLVK